MPIIINRPADTTYPPSSQGVEPSHDTRRRIAVLTESFTMGGVERATLSLLGSLDRSKFDPILICVDHPSIEPFVNDAGKLGVPVYRLDLPTGERLWNLPARMYRLHRFLRDQRIDLLHIQLLGGLGSRFTTLTARMAGVPVIIAVHGALQSPLSWPARRVARYMGRFVKAYVTVSHHNRDLQITHAWRRAEQVRVIYNGIDSRHYLPGTDRVQARSALPVAQSGPLIGTIGRLAEQKGIPYFLDMARRVRECVPDACFMIIGDGEDREKLEALARKQGLADCVAFTGYREDTARCLAAMNVFVLASVFEPFGLVLAEAMATQTPVVATRVGGIPEVVEDGRTGMLVPPRDGQALAEAVVRYLRDPELSHQHGMAGRKRVIELFTVDRMAANTQRLYDEVLGMASDTPVGAEAVCSSRL